MTREQAYGQVCTWFAEGRLRVLVGENYTDWTASTPPRWEAFQRDHNRQRFCRREDGPQMPDEVWIPDYKIRLTPPHAYLSAAECKESNNSATPTRYVRADRIIDGNELEFRNSDSDIWRAANGCKYRLKP